MRTRRVWVVRNQANGNSWATFTEDDSAIGVAYTRTPEAAAQFPSLESAKRWYAKYNFRTSVIEEIEVPYPGGQTELFPAGHT